MPTAELNFKRLMKTMKLFSMAALLATGFAACNNDSDGTASADTTATDVNTTTTTSTTVSTTGNYAALADSARINSEAGYYLDARTGKPLRINVDPQTGVRTNAETGEPVWRYVDSRTWWVYGGTPDQPEWTNIGEARMEGSKIEFKDSKNTWVDYDRLYRDLDLKNGEEWKMKVGDTKIKVEEDGDMKIKTPDGKYKVDEDGSKLKTDDKKVKVDEDGTKVKEDNK
jgi:hypothetical protein